MGLFLSSGCLGCADSFLFGAGKAVFRSLIAPQVAREFFPLEAVSSPWPVDRRAKRIPLWRWGRLVPVANRRAPRGVVRLTYRDQKRLNQDARSHCRHRIPPFARRLGSEDPQRRSRDEMALKVEGVVDRGMHAEEALGRSSRFEPLHFALSSPHRLM